MPINDVIVVGGGIPAWPPCTTFARSSLTFGDALRAEPGSRHYRYRSHRRIQFRLGAERFPRSRTADPGALQDLGLNDQLERANDRMTNRFILRGGKLRYVPMSRSRL